MLPYALATASRNEFMKKVKNAAHENINILMILIVAIHSLLSLIFPFFFVSCFCALLCWFLLSKTNYTLLNFWIPFISMSLILYSSSNSNLFFLEKCFVLMIWKDIQYEVSIKSLRKSFLILIAIFFIIVNGNNRFLLLISLITSIVLGQYAPLEKTSPHIHWTYPSLALAVFIQVFSPIPLDAIILSLISLINIDISFMPTIYFSKDAKRLLYFFAINFLFMFVEVMVGYSTNSLGLISDAFHMLCDNVSLIFSCLASLLSHQKETKTFPFGLKQIENICTLSNVVILFFISFNLLSEAITRLINPPVIKKDNLIIVSIIGFFVNLVGLFFTNTKSESNTFMKSIYLHILVDTMGSISVIISSIFISKFSMFLLDPLCSLFISFSIFYSAIPLFENIFNVLILSVKEKEAKNRIISDIRKYGTIKNIKMWYISPGELYADIQIKSNNHFIPNNNEFASQKYQESLVNVSNILKKNNIEYSTIEIVI